MFDCLTVLVLGGAQVQARTHLGGVLLDVGGAFCVDTCVRATCAVEHGPYMD